MDFTPISYLKPELVIWEDISQCDSTWASHSDLADWLSDVADAHVEQVGFVVAESDKILILADSFIESMGLYGNCHKIPKSCIISRTILTKNDDL